MDEHTSVIADSQQTRICSNCGERLPASAFQRVGKGSQKLRSICRCCCRDYARERRREQRRRRFHELTSDGLGVYQRRGAAELAAVVREAIREFGGLSNMAKLWKDAVDEATAKGRYCSVIRSLNFFHACNVAVKQLELEEDAAEDERLGRLSIEELERERLRVARRAIQGDPRLVLRAAADLGWEVRPPITRD